jgi:LAGLIDADG endonuclease
MLQFEQIKAFFGVGRIKIQKERGNRKASVYFIVDSFKDCLIICDHFKKYPLLSTKLVHFNI